MMMMMMMMISSRWSNISIIMNTFSVSVSEIKILIALIIIIIDVVVVVIITHRYVLHFVLVDVDTRRAVTKALDRKDQCWSNQC